LPTIGLGGPNSTPEAEKLVSVQPDVIFVAYLVDRAQADELQAKTNIPVPPGFGAYAESSREGRVQEIAH
jgi:ABC-type Fe3+-hydroxamate transport system substrate-binding protein